MEPEVLVRRAALVALLLLLLAGYLLRSTEPESPVSAPKPSPSTPASISVTDALFSPPSESAPSVVPSVGDEFGARRAPKPPPPPVDPAPTPATRLPEATVVQSEKPVAPQGSPCGGLVVRLITMADDPKFAFASLAQGYGAEAKILHVGESLAGYRVTGIEWDRVWVQGRSGRCAVGMHLGAREAESEVQDQASAEAYARLPWVLPHEITSGMFKRSEMDWELTEDAIVKLYERGADVFAGLRVRPRKGADGGLELSDVRLDSFLERLGILSGDVLVKIGDEPITTADDVSRSLDAAREESELLVEFERNGENYQLRLRVQGFR